MNTVVIKNSGRQAVLLGTTRQAIVLNTARIVHTEPIRIDTTNYFLSPWQPYPVTREASG